MTPMVDLTPSLQPIFLYKIILCFSHKLNLLQRMDAKGLEIQETLKDSGAVATEQHKNNPTQEEKAKKKAQKKADKAKKKEEKEKRKGHWLERQRSALMVVASLIATMAFQSAASPPDNLWTAKADKLAGAPAPNPQIHASDIDRLWSTCKYLKNGERFFAINTTSFIASLSIILLLMSGLPLDSRFVMWILIVITWVAISAIALSYTVNVILHTPDSDEVRVYNLVAITIYSWIGLVTFLLVGHTVRICFRVIRCVFGLFVMMVRMLVRALRDMWRRCHPRPDDVRV